MILRDRMVAEFLELTAIDAPSFGERTMADSLLEKLRAAGFTAYEDEAARAIGGTAGNLVGRLSGTLAGPPLLLAAHMDTVEPACGKRPALQADGTIRSAGDTVLGGDDICGVVEILEAVRHLREEGLPHRDVEVLITAAEEVYGKGVKALDPAALQSRECYVLDMSGDVGSAAVAAPSLISFSIVVRGRASHAGFAPQDGIHAIAAAADAIGRIEMGQIDPATTLNIGTIAGGEATNIVPAECVVTGEVRSSSHERAREAVAHVKEVFESVDERVTVEFSAEEHLVAYDTPPEHPVVQRFLRACEKLSLPGRTVRTFGGSDNNILRLYGITGIVLSCGMERVHSTEEYTTVRELEKGAALVAELLQQP